MIIRKSIKTVHKTCRKSKLCVRNGPNVTGLNGKALKSWLVKAFDFTFSFCKCFRITLYAPLTSALIH